jgi:hypothetical protein
MTQARVTFVYNGLLADEHLLRSTDIKTVVDGAQLLVGAHCYFYTRGSIPENVLDRTRDFSLDGGAVDRGSWKYDLVVNLAGAFLTGGAWAAGRYAFDKFLVESISNWKLERLWNSPEFVRREPFFETQPPWNAPVFDSEADSIRVRQDLFRRTGNAMQKLTSPIGKSAHRLDIFVNDELAVTMDRRFARDLEISQALEQLQLRPRGYLG